MPYLVMDFNVRMILGKEVVKGCVHLKFGGLIEKEDCYEKNTQEPP
jgi:hypothetical protein